MTIPSENLSIYNPETQQKLNKALQEYRAKNLNEVEEILNTILAEEPNHVEALKLRAMLAHRTNNFKKAILEYKKIITIVPSDANSYAGLGSLYQQQANFNEAINYYQQSLSLAPSCNAYYGLARCLILQGKLDEAIHYLNQGLTIEPENPRLRWERGLTFLKSGKYEEGLPDFEYRLQLPRVENYAPLKHSMWDGSDLNGKDIVLHIGSRSSRAIQLIRYAPLVAQRGGKVIFACPKLLLRVLSNVSGIDQLVDRTEISLGDFEVNASLLSLPYLLGTTLSTIPANIPYIPLPTSEQWTDWDVPSLPRASLNTRLKIGIVWTTGEYERSGSLCDKDCPLSFFIDLLSISNISLYSLQVGKWATEINEFKHDWLYNLTPQIKDFADTAALISQLDLIISVDTAVAHLAGAMGMPVWTLLPFDADWRWLKDRENSPWYPSMRLFRQRQHGNWESVFEQVIPALKNYLAILESTAQTEI